MFLTVACKHLSEETGVKSMRGVPEESEVLDVEGLKFEYNQNRPSGVSILILCARTRCDCSRCLPLLPRHG